jgi:hypothetical protein
MITALVMATLAVAPPGPAPGRGARLWTELGATRYSAAYEASRAAAVGKTGIDGFGARVHSGLGFDIGSGFFLGPAVGFDYAATGTSGGVCCGTIHGVTTARVGLEAALYPSVNIGFRISGGFGLAFATLHGDNDARERMGPLASVSAYGSYWTLALARDYNVGARTRIGGVLRVESEVLRGGSDDHVYHLRTFTPSLSLVVLSHFGS